MKKTTAIILALVLIFALALPAAAAEPTAKSVTAYTRGISVFVDGEPVTLADATGRLIEPFIIGGTTYLPLRAVAAALGLGVDWDGETATVLLTTGGTPSLGSGKPLATGDTRALTVYYNNIKITLDGKKLTPTDANGAVVEPFILDGTTYLPLRAVANALGEKVEWYAESSSIYLGKRPTWLLASESRVWDDGSTSGTSYEYDSRGRLVSATYEGSGMSLYEYDAAGRCVVEKSYSPDEQITYYTYDANGYLIREEYGSSSGAGNCVETYVNDAAGNALSCTVTRPDGARTIQETTYDASGNMLTQKTTWYLGDGSLYERSTETCAYDERGNRTSYLYVAYNEAGASVGGYRTATEYGYDPAGRVLTQTERFSPLSAGGAELDPTVTAYSYEYDAYGNLVRMTGTGGMAGDYTARYVYTRAWI